MLPERRDPWQSVVDLKDICFREESQLRQCLLRMDMKADKAFIGNRFKTRLQYSRHYPSWPSRFNIDKGKGRK